ncbi:hypothetical protein MTO96_007988 [Rhipicephalus appendiculatus]
MKEDRAEAGEGACNHSDPAAETQRRPFGMPPCGPSRDIAAEFPPGPCVRTPALVSSPSIVTRHSGCRLASQATIRERCALSFLGGLVAPAIAKVAA